MATRTQKIKRIVEIRTNSKSAANELKLVNTQLRTTNKTLQTTNKSIRSMDKSMSSINGTMRSLQQMALATVGAFGAREIMDIALQYGQLEAKLTAVTGSMEEMGEEWNYITTLADKMGQRVPALVDSYASLAAATKGTNAEGEETKKIFEGIVTASTALQLSQDQVKGAINAVQQMFSKGKVQAEELRGQLGERLPGAFKMAAEAMEVTELQLNDMLEKGEVLASDLLPRLADILTDRYGEAAKNASETARASFNRAQNALEEFVTSALNDTGALQAFAKVVESIAESLEDLSGVLAAGAILGGIYAITKAVKGLRIAMVALSFNPLMLAITAFVGLTGIVYSATAGMREYKGAVDDVNDAQNNLDQREYADTFNVTKLRMNELQDEMDGLQAKHDALTLAIEKATEAGDINAEGLATLTSQAEAVAYSQELLQEQMDSTTKEIVIQSGALKKLNAALIANAEAISESVAKRQETLDLSGLDKYESERYKIKKKYAEMTLKDAHANNEEMIKVREAGMNRELQLVGELEKKEKAADAAKTARRKALSSANKAATRLSEVQAKKDREIAARQKKDLKIINDLYIEEKGVLGELADELEELMEAQDRLQISDERRAEQQKILIDSYDERIKKEMEAQNQLSETEKETIATLESISEEIETGIGDAFYGMMTGVENSWSDLWGNLKDIMLKQIANMAAAAVSRAIVVPIMGSMVGMAGMGTANAAAGFLGNAAGGGGGGGLLGGGGGLLSSANTLFGGTSAIGGMMTGASGILGSMLGGTTFGAGLGIGGAALSTGGIGGYVGALGSVIGGGAGMGAILGTAVPAIGAALAIASLLGAFDEKKTTPFGRSGSFLGNSLPFDPDVAYNPLALGTAAVQRHKPGIVQETDEKYSGYNLEASYTSSVGRFNAWTGKGYFDDQESAQAVADTIYALGDLEQSLVNTFVESEDEADKLRDTLSSLSSTMEDYNGFSHDALLLVRDQMAKRFKGLFGELNPALLQMAENMGIFQLSLDDMAAGLAAVVTLQTYLDADIAEDYARGIEEANKTLYDSLHDNAQAISDQVAAYDGSIESLQEIAELTQERYAMELQFLGQIQAATEAVAGILGDRIESLTLEAMPSDRARFEYTADKIDELILQLQESTDPTEVVDLIQQIDSMLGQQDRYYQSYLSEQQSIAGSNPGANAEAIAAEYESYWLDYVEQQRIFAEELQLLTNGKLEEMSMSITESSDGVREEISNIGERQLSATQEVTQAIRDESAKEDQRHAETMSRLDRGGGGFGGGDGDDFQHF